MTSKPEKEREQQIAFLSETIKKYRHHLPKERKPNILICGKTGNGKTSTINTLFGQEVGKVGHFSRGTDTDEVYEWESNEENINIVDLPGLGDSPKNDKIFKEIYRRRIKEADGFIVIVCPPRPAELGTLKTVNLLISSGVSSKHIIFGYNKLSDIRYQDNGKLSQVEIDGLIGSTSPKHTQAIVDAKKAFLETLQREIPCASFSEYQIIEYDSLSGWNLHKMLLAVVEMLPFEALVKLNRAREAAERQAIKKEKDRLKEEREFIRQEEERLKQANAQSLREKEVLKQRRRHIEEREEAVENFSNQGEQFNTSILNVIISGVEAVITLIDPSAGATIGAARKVITSVGNVASKAWNAVSSWFR
ncbi:MAG: GTPase family protein [Nostoc sp. EfeVER01]|uniref:GTPase family protein n=1 Tax=unclassified Nostoc TaxID=2593658 RepID=UPI002AD1E14C|nr:MULTISPECIES: GTPase [unclassified Nostoc]MDZ7948362.1 GTPase [Nostoc sp. EfeVER01]MDZ7995339.1 GTPase [Nostoc sp. EspVER01]